MGTLRASTITTTATALGSTYASNIALTCSATGIASGNGFSLRAITTLSGTVTGGAFLSGIRCGMAISGTMNHADSRLSGAFVKLDTTGATLTAGQLSGLWVDHGAGVTGAGGGQFNMIRITNTVSGSKPNAIIYGYSDATYVMDLDAPGGSRSWAAAAGASNAGTNGGKAADGVLILSLGGSPIYVPYFTANS